MKIPTQHLIAGGVIGSGLALAILSQLIAARWMGPAAFGRFAYITGVASTVGLIAKLGYDAAAIKYLAVHGETGEDRHSILRFLVRRTIFMGILGSAVFLGIALFDGQSSVVEISFSVIVVALSGLTLVYLSSLVAVGQVAKGFLFETHLRSWLFLALLFLLPLSEVPASSSEIAVIAFSLASGASAVTLWWTVTRRQARRSPYLSSTLKAEIHSFSWTMGGAAAISALWARADIILAAWLVDDWRLTGAYAVATRLRALVASIETILDPVFSPRIARAYAASGWRGFPIIRRQYTVTAIAWAISMFGATLLFGESILALLGEDYSDAFGYLTVLLVAQVIKSVLGPVHIMLSMTHMERGSLYASGIAFSIFIVLSIVLGGVYGIWGLTYASAIGIVSKPILQALFLRFMQARWRKLDKECSLADQELQ